MLNVYLDQNKWIDLARADHGRDERFRDVLDLAFEGTRQGFLRFPLSSVHYMETWNHRKAKRRWQLAATMLKLSRPPTARAPHTIAGPPEIVPMEIDLALSARFGKPFSPRGRDIFGQGFAHAFGQPDYWFKAPEGMTLSGDQIGRLEYAATRFIEAAMVSGPAQDLPVPGIDSETYKTYSQKYKARDETLGAAFTWLKLDKAIRERWLVAFSLLDIKEPLSEALARAGIGWDEFEALGADGLTEFLRHVPSRYVDYELHRLRHENPQSKREVGDLDDLAALSIAVVYCDVVVTERQWVHLIRRALLDQLYGTTVLYDLRELAPLMAAGRLPTNYP